MLHLPFYLFSQKVYVNQFNNKSFLQKNSLYLLIQLLYVMKNQKLTLLRLQKQQSKLQQQPLPNVLITRKGLLNFHFCIYGLDGAYKGGYYHGVLQLHQDYPFQPPRLIFITPSGRFQTEKSICTTFTNFHKQAWTSAWNVRTMVTATISFMTSDEQGVGGLNDSYLSKKRYASQSLNWNLKNKQFCQLFKQKLFKIDSNITHNAPYNNNNNQSLNAANENKISKSSNLYILYAALVIIIFLWAYLKADSTESNL